MKRGFALLETIIVVTILSVSLILLYSPFRDMISNSKKNVLYDDASNIYKAYYLKEYLNLYGLENLDTDNMKELSCSNFIMASCNTLIEKFNIHKIYLMKYDVKMVSVDNSSLVDYLKTLSNKEDYTYRLVVEFNNEPNYSYASIGIGGTNE